MRPLSQSTAIVTGAGRGIGRAIALRLARAGANVALVSRSDEQLHEVRRTIAASGGSARVIPIDISDDAAVAAMVDSVVGWTGRVDVLVNNAGVVTVATIDAMAPAAFDKMLAINCRAVYSCCRAVWRQMAAHGGGTILNVSSMASFDPFPGLGLYGATKSFVNALTKGLSAEGAAAGIRVLAIAPGAVDTDMLRGAFPDYPAEKALNPDGVAEFVELLLSPGSAHVGGQTFMIRKE